MFKIKSKNNNKKVQYVLIEVSNREIKEPQVFASEFLAKDALLRRISMLERIIDGDKKSFIDKNSKTAYLITSDCRYDWSIFSIPILNL